MKNKIIGCILIFIVLAFINNKVNAQVMDAGSPNSFSDAIKRYLEAEASLELVKNKQKGVSISGKDRAKAGQNLGILIGFDFARAILPKIQKGSGTYNFDNNNRFLETASIDSSVSLRDRFPMDKKKSMGHPYFVTGLEYVTKNTTESQGSSSEDIDLSYLEVPAIFNYQLPVNDISALHFGIGPYFAYAISGNFKGQGQKTPIVFGNDPNKDDYKRTDLGLIVNAGYLIARHWNLTLQYDFGLKNISATPPDPDSHLGGFSLHFGYRWY